MIHLVQAREYVYMNKDLTAGGKRRQLTSVNCKLVFLGFQGKPDRCTHIRCAAYMDGLLMGFDNMFTNRQSQTGAAFIPAAWRNLCGKIFQKSSAGVLPQCQYRRQ